MRTQRVVQIRQQRGLTQEDAARIARVSVATWRRLEADEGARFRADTIRGIRRALGLSERELEALLHDGAELDQDAEGVAERAWIDDFNRYYRDSALTPRQAASVSAALGMWRDGIDRWIGSVYEGRHASPLWETEPFHLLDLRVLIAVNDNTAWVAAFAERIERAEALMYEGTLLGLEPECVADEVIFGLAVESARGGFDDEVSEGLWAELDEHDEDADWDYDLIFEDLDWEWFRHEHHLVDLGMAGRPPLTWFTRASFARS